MSEPPPETFSYEEVTPLIPGRAEDHLKRLGFRRPFLSAAKYWDALAGQDLPPLQCAIEVTTLSMAMKWPFHDIQEVVHDYPISDYGSMLNDITYTLDPAPRQDRLEILGKALSLCFMDASASGTSSPEMCCAVINLIASLSAALVCPA